MLPLLHSRRRRSTRSIRDVNAITSRATDKAWVGLSVEKLARHGLVERSADTLDQRRTLVSLTTRGKDVHDAIMTNARRRQRRLLAALPPGTAETLVVCLDNLQAEADRMLAELDEEQGTEPSG